MSAERGRGCRYPFILIACFCPRFVESVHVSKAACHLLRVRTELALSITAGSAVVHDRILVLAHGSWV